MIEVSAAPTETGWSCLVEIEEGGRASRHSVRVARADLERWGARGGVEDLVRRSFQFLLQRETPGQILKSFDLADIQRYFPEYPEAIEA